MASRNRLSGRTSARLRAPKARYRSRSSLQTVPTAVLLIEPLALNSTRPQALQVAIYFSAGATQVHGSGGQLLPEVRGLLDAHLHPGFDPSLAITWLGGLAPNEYGGIGISVLE